MSTSRRSNLKRKAAKDKSRLYLFKFKKTDSDNEEDQIPSGDRPQIELIFKPGRHYHDCMVVPYEILVKIFDFAISTSDHPLRDLCSIARTCETWRHIILQTPKLWSRMDLTQVPATDRNFNNINKVIQQCPDILESVKELSFRGALKFKNQATGKIVEQLLTAPNLSNLNLSDMKTQNKISMPTLLFRSIGNCRKLQEIHLTQSRILFNNQKWLVDYLTENGKTLTVLNLSMSLNMISSQLIRAIGSEFCPNLQFLDISTCDSLNTHSFDAIQLTQSMPNLRVLRVGNVSFKRVYSAPDIKGLRKLRELSMPIGMRDADRDDALFATLTFGSDNITTLDLRGSSITAHALIEMPSYNMRELHMDDLCPITRRDYHRVIAKWAHSLEVLSLVKINCAETVKSCLKAISDSDSPKLRVLDLSSSDVTTPDLKHFLSRVKSINSIDLSSCRSLPRGCKGLYSKNPTDTRTQNIRCLEQKLK